MARYSAWIGGKVCGPFSLEQIAKQPQIDLDTRVIPEGKTKKEDWVRVRQVPELMALLSRGSPALHRPSDQPPPVPTQPKPPPLPNVPTGSSGALPVTRTLERYVGRVVIGGLLVGGVSAILAFDHWMKGLEPPALPSATSSEPRPPAARSASPPATSSRPRLPSARYHNKKGQAGFDEFRNLAEALQAKKTTFPTGPIYFGAPEEIGAERAAGEILLIPWEDGAFNLLHTPAPAVVKWEETGDSRRFLIMWPPGKVSYRTELLAPIIVYVECDMALPLRRSHLIFARNIGTHKFQNQYGETHEFHALRAFAAASGNNVEYYRGVNLFNFDPETVFTFDDNMIARLKR